MQTKFQSIMRPIIKLNERNALKSYIGQYLAFYESHVDALIQTWNAACASNKNENIILFGPGGYGKSDVAMLFFNYMRDNNYITDASISIKTFGDNTTPDDVYGGYNIPKYRDTGIKEYMVEASIFNSELVVLEELFDAQIDTLLAFKDPLTSGYVRNATQNFKIKTKMVIVCTNREPNYIMQDNSSKAVAERFIFSSEVKWHKHDTESYVTMLNIRHGNLSNKFMIYMMASIANQVNHNRNSNKKREQYDINLSPRTIDKSFKSILANDYEGLANLDKAFTDVELKTSTASANSISKYSSLFLDVLVNITDFKDIKRDIVENAIPSSFNKYKNYLQELEINNNKNVEFKRIKGVIELINEYSTTDINSKPDVKKAMDNLPFFDSDNNCYAIPAYNNGNVFNLASAMVATAYISTRLTPIINVSLANNSNDSQIIEVVNNLIDSYINLLSNVKDTFLKFNTNKRQLATTAPLIISLHTKMKTIFEVNEYDVELSKLNETSKIGLINKINNLVSDEKNQLQPLFSESSPVARFYSQYETNKTINLGISN